MAHAPALGTVHIFCDDPSEGDCWNIGQILPSFSQGHILIYDIGLHPRRALWHSLSNPRTVRDAEHKEFADQETLSGATTDESDNEGEFSQTNSAEQDS
ncbi:hypothetical protein BG003_005468 [Podila horticola]|nr:hypothetical protein BG003_005468 [Podila horticola]